MNQPGQRHDSRFPFDQPALRCARLAAGAMVLIATSTSVWAQETTATEDVTNGVAESQTGGVVESRTLKASDCFLLIKDEAAVPARDRGVLIELLVEPGTIVSANEVLGRLDDTEARLNVETARIELKSAEKDLNDSVDTDIAESSLAEIEASLELARVEQTIATLIAKTSVAVRIAENAAKLAEEELSRGQRARDAFKSSVSAMKLIELQTTLDEKRLQVENAVHEKSVDELRQQSREVAVSQQSKAVERLRLELTEARTEQALARLGIERLEKSVALAEEKLRRREVRSPLNGLIVERKKHPGEWVETGEAVLRVVRLDRLLVEGYVPATEVGQSTVGAAVEVTVGEGASASTTTGRVVFVSPEVDRVNHEVAVRAEIENEQLVLKPGQRASMTIRLGPRIDE